MRSAMHAMQALALAAALVARAGPVTCGFSAQSRSAVAVGSRRSALVHAAAITASTLLVKPGSAVEGTHRGDAPVLASALFSAGDSRFLQPAFDFIGVHSTLVGSLRAAADGAELPALVVSYDPAILTYKQVIGAFYRSINPTSSAVQGQFGTMGPSVIWASSEAEFKIAQESRRRLPRVRLFQGRAIETEVRAIDRGGRLRGAAAKFPALRSDVQF
mmetsp:Transcript_33682/g.83926  ORF Transcript_33682/g.83926 Transcript_33682/m.83926 type:complete len:217 (-) Transcript_33682:756-1406(-)